MTIESCFADQETHFSRYGTNRESELAILLFGLASHEICITPRADPSQFLINIGPFGENKVTAATHDSPRFACYLWCLSSQV